MILVCTGFGWQPLSEIVRHYRKMARMARWDGSSAYPEYRERLRQVVTQVRTGEARMVEGFRHAA